MPTRKTTKDQWAYITQADSPANGMLSSQLAGFPLTLLQSKKAKVLALPHGQVLSQRQTAE